MGRAGRSEAGRSVTPAAGAAREVLLQDGARVGIRRSCASDSARVAELYGRMSPDPVFQRFVAVMAPLVDWARLAAADDADGRCMLLAEDMRASPPDLVAVSSAESIDLAEDRVRWISLCSQLEIPLPGGGSAVTV